MTGRISRLETLDAEDGSGVRVFVSLQGCNLRCVTCCNPETWDTGGGTEISAQALAEKLIGIGVASGAAGSVILSGGEPLLQAEFAGEVLSRCKAAGLHTRLDTSGCVCSASVLRMLRYADSVRLALKYTTREDYRAYVKGSMRQTMRFLNVLQAMKIPVWLYQVTVKGLNDDEENLDRLADIVKDHPCVERVELVPMSSRCAENYERLGLDFPLRDTTPPDKGTMERLNGCLHGKLSIRR